MNLTAIICWAALIGILLFVLRRKRNSHLKWRAAFEARPLVKARIAAISGSEWVENGPMYHAHLI